MNTNKPNLFVVGAPRSGTSHLYELLKAHSAISVCKRKEPYFFSQIHETSELHALLKPISNYEIYKESFLESQKPGIKYLAETSTTYCWFPNAAEGIKAFNPDAKIIFIFRDPIERFFSHYKLHKYKYAVGSDLPTILKNLDKPTNSFDEHLVNSGYYSRYVDHYKTLFPSENILIFNHVDFFANYNGSLLKLKEFLQLDDSFVESFKAEKVNAGYAQNPMSKTIHDLRNKLFPFSLPVPNFLKKLYQNQLEVKLKESERATLENHYEKDIQFYNKI